MGKIRNARPDETITQFQQAALVVLSHTQAVLVVIVKLIGLVCGCTGCTEEASHTQATHSMVRVLSRFHL